MTRQKILDYLTHRVRSGVTPARKLASLQEFFHFLQENSLISVSPAVSVSMPKKERKQRAYLRPEEFTRILVAAAGNVRDYAILQVFLQTGIRVFELANLTLAHLDVQARILSVAGKGKKQRTIEVEKKSLQAINSYLAVRPTYTLDEHVFLHHRGKGLSVRGIQDIVEKYVKLAGIEKNFSAHSLRHTFAS